VPQAEAATTVIRTIDVATRTLEAYGGGRQPALVPTHKPTTGTRRRGGGWLGLNGSPSTPDVSVPGRSDDEPSLGVTRDGNVLTLQGAQRGR